MPKAKDLDVKKTKKSAPAVEEEQEKELDPDLLLGDDEAHSESDEDDINDLGDDSEDSDPFGDRWEE